MHGTRHGILHAIPRCFLHGIRRACLASDLLFARRLMSRAETSISKRGVGKGANEATISNLLLPLFLTLFLAHFRILPTVRELFSRVPSPDISR